jgi:hypothetical protein
VAGGSPQVLPMRPPALEVVRREDPRLLACLHCHGSSSRRRERDLGRRRRREKEADDEEETRHWGASV